MPARARRVEDMVARSRFVTTLAHAPAPQDAHAVVDAVRDEFSDATHHCWAFVAGAPGATTQIGLSDAGVVHALPTIPNEVKTVRARFDVVVGYAHVDAVRRLLGEVGAAVEAESYGEDVRYRVGVPAAEAADFAGRLADVTAVEARVDPAGDPPG